MRYLCTYQTEKPGPLDPKREAALMALLADMSKAGVLLSTEGCSDAAKGFRVRAQGGKLTVTDGPFPETKEVLGGICLMQVKSRAEALEWAKRFIAIMGEGMSEAYLLNEPGQPHAEQSAAVS